MKKVLITTTLTTLIGFQAQAGQVEILTTQARDLIKDFGGTLKHELQGAMKSGGPVKAIGVCNTKAPGIARDKSHAAGWDIGRTSLKIRNPQNRPDDWEKTVLLRFEERKAKGEDPKMIDYSEIISTADGKHFRYMKAIPTGKVCLNCHGEKLKPEVEGKLGMLYPEDKARGFKVGDLRGAFTLSKPL